MDTVAQSSNQTLDTHPSNSSCDSRRRRLTIVTEHNEALPTCHTYNTCITYLPTTPNESWTYVEQDGGKYICTCTPGRWCTCRTTIKRTSTELRDGHK